MAETPLIWNSSARKEALELLERLWARGDDAVRARLTEVLAAGPPDHLGPQDDAEEHARSRDRRIFDRVALLERDGGPPLTPGLQATLGEIRQRNPGWILPDGDQARFGWWMEVRAWDDYAPHYEQMLKAASPGAIADYLVKQRTPTDDHLDGLSDAWRRFSSDKPDQAVAVLEQFVQRDDGGPPDLWRAALWGLRDSVQESKILNPVLDLILLAPAGHFTSVDYVRAVADLLQGATRGSAAALPESFWQVFDQTLAAAQNDPDNRAAPDDGRWISAAINRSMGYLAAAFFSGLIALGLKAGDGVPAEHRARLDALVGLGDPAHRFARVIAASRLPYLFAVDPAWAEANLIPLLDWDRAPDEALATWQGFAWHPRVSEDLWALIKSSFLSTFTPARLEALGSSRTTMAHLVMLAGVEFDLPAEAAREAIRAMTDEMRAEAIWWLWSDLQSGDDADDTHGADARWLSKVRPWLAKAWPKDPDLITRTVGQRFALLPTALDEAFPDAVAFVLPFVVPGDGDFVLHHLQEGGQAPKHPAATLQLLGAVLRDGELHDPEGIAAMLGRIVEALPAAREDPVYRLISTRIAPFRPAI